MHADQTTAETFQFCLCMCHCDMLTLLLGSFMMSLWCFAGQRWEEAAKDTLTCTQSQTLDLRMMGGYRGPASKAAVKGNPSIFNPVTCRPEL